MADDTAEYRAHLATYTSFNKLVTFMILWIVLLLSSMALGLVGGVHILALLMGIGGTIVLLIAFAVLGSLIGPRASCALMIMSAQDARGPFEP